MPEKHSDRIDKHTFSVVSGLRTRELSNAQMKQENDLDSTFVVRDRE